MGKTVFKLNSAGVRELLKSAEVAEECRMHAQAVQSTAGEGYIVEQRNYAERSGYAVSADTMKARLDNFYNNTLLKALR